MIRTIYVYTACCLLFAGTQLLAQNDDTVVDSSELDRALLEDLDNDLFDGLDIPTDIPDKKESSENAEDQKPKTLEDLGKQADPLTKIGQQMQNVQQQMSTGDAKQETLDQQIQIVKAIDDLIEEMKKQQQQQKQQQQSSSSKQNQEKQQQQKNQQQNQQQKNQQKPSGSQDPMPMQGESQEQQKQGNKNAKNSDEELRNQQIELLPVVARSALLKETWGHLPEKIRQQLMNTSVEKFLPKYEKLTEDYFRKLAEETNE
ncbi:MAG: hypothetical protein ACKVH8_10295 [Pirellulales bacterium]